jgi:tight adherence protein C
MERNRVRKLRDNYASYRWFEPLVLELAKINRNLMAPGQQLQIASELNVAQTRTPWKPSEYYAVKQTESLLLGLGIFAVLAIFLPVVLAALVGAIVAAINLALAIMAIPQVAAGRRRQFKRRLPHAVDIMALLLQAGANFDDAIKVVAREDRGNALGDEFSRIKQQLDLNRSQVEALSALKDRIQDDDTSDLIRAICNGIELGTPMSEILKTQADQMRLKRSQWGEKAAKEAEIKMTGPNLLIMLACVIVIMGPILLPIVYGGGMGF